MTFPCRLRKAIGLLCGLLFLFVVAVSPAAAHKEHEKKRQQTEQVHQVEQRGVAVQPGIQPTAAPGAGEVAEPARDRSQMSTGERLLDWLGRLHPIIVHFPVAFFPAALLAAIVGRRRPALAAPAQFLVVAGGIMGPIAAIFGWLDGGFDIASDDWLLQWHRWLGTSLGLGALALGIWALRKPEAVRGTGMIAALALITAATIVQGWFGGAMVHGVDHLNW